jgi:uncharacterized membrane protein YjgN (DUF898 family)
MIFTLGLYYPWAKVKNYKFFFNNTQLNGTGFHFNGTGNELFKGFLLFVFGLLTIIGSFYLSTYLAQNFEMPIAIFIFFIVAFAFFTLVVPFAIHNRMRYLSSRTVWRGVYFNFDGKLGSFYKTYYMDVFFLFLSFGFYYFWLKSNLIRFRISNLKLGNIEFQFRGDGGELFFCAIVTSFQTLIVVGIISIPLIALGHVLQLENPYVIFSTSFPILAYAFGGLIGYNFNLRYYFNNTILIQKGNIILLSMNITIGEILKLLAKPFVQTLLSLGICAPIFIAELFKLFVERIKFSKPLELHNIPQSYSEQKSTIGENLSDFLDIDII